MPDTAPPTGAPNGTIRTRWWTELPLVVLVYAAYSAGRALARGDASTATGNGLAILRVEHLLHLDAEHPLNRLFTAHPALGIPADFAYASLHYLVTPAVLVWLWRRRPAHYRSARTWLLLSTVIALVGFTLVPTCPPRLLDASHGFVDTMARFASYGWWGGDASAPRGLGGLANQYAAMPSLHVGWSLWCGVVLWRYGRTRLVRVAGAGYPLLTTVVVMGTANHYCLDAVAGAAVIGLGFPLTRPVLRLLARLRAGISQKARAAAPHAPRPQAAAPSDVAPVAGGPPRPTAPITPTGGGTPTVVSAGCETSAGERIHRQPTRGGRSGGTATAGPATADDGAPAAAR